MLTEIKVVKLFSRFDYKIAINVEGVTILTGPNGYGKSTILKAIDSLYSMNLKFFFDLDFRFLEFHFTSPDYILSFDKSDESSIKINDVLLPRQSSERKSLLEMRRKERMMSKYVMDDDYYPRKELRNYAMHIFKESHEYLADGDFNSFLRYIDVFPPELFDMSEKKDVQKITSLFDSLKKAKESLGHMHFIKDQRLLLQKKRPGTEKEVINVIEDIPQMLKRQIDSVSKRYSAIANKLDSTYPNRLFNTSKGISEEEYKDKMEEMNEKFEKLDKYDISNLQNSVDVIFNKTHAIALEIYFSDFNEKYKVYEDFIKKLDLFTEIINNRLSFKEIRISSEYGIMVVDTDKPSRRLSLNQLSSGEKQEIVMFYELIFEAQERIMLLIDEPEISLHIVWQKMFMDDLLKIVEYKGFTVVVATHSPQIINNHWDDQIDLGALYAEQLNLC